MTKLTYQEIYALICSIPRGRVATYGQIARLAGIPGHARQVGYALSRFAGRNPIPWHRVVNSKGMISPRSDAGPMELVQRRLLEEEGVSFDENGRIPLSRYQWRLGS